MNKKCNKCGGTLPEGALFCMKCGEKVVEVACSQCGKSLPEEAKFCVYCGQVIGKEEAQSTPVDIATIEETSTPQVTAAVEDEFANSDAEELEEEQVDPDTLFYEEINAAYLAFVDETDCKDEAAELNHFIESFETLGNYKDAADKKSICQERLLDIKYTALMKRMEGAEEIAALIQLEKGFEKLGDYKDALEQRKICQKRIDWQVNVKREESEKQKAQARIEEQNNRDIQRKKNMRIGLGCGIAVILLIIIIVAPGGGNDTTTAVTNTSENFSVSSIGIESLPESTVSPLESEYEEAVQLLNEGAYEEARTIFAALDGYADSTDKLNEIDDYLWWGDRNEELQGWEVIQEMESNAVRADEYFEGQLCYAKFTITSISEDFWDDGMNNIQGDLVGYEDEGAFTSASAVNIYVKDVRDSEAIKYSIGDTVYVYGSISGVEENTFLSGLYYVYFEAAQLSSTIVVPTLDIQDGTAIDYEAIDAFEGKWCMAHNALTVITFTKNDIAGELVVSLGEDGWNFSGGEAPYTEYFTMTVSYSDIEHVGDKYYIQGLMYSVYETDINSAYVTMIGESSGLSVETESTRFEGSYWETNIVSTQNQAIVTESSDYLLPSNTRYLTLSDLYGFTADEAALARNEIYARYGYNFTNATYQAYFNAQSWYQSVAGLDSSTFSSSVFNAYEFANIDIIKEYEAMLS